MIIAQKLYTQKPFVRPLRRRNQPARPRETARVATIALVPGLAIDVIIETKSQNVVLFLRRLLSDRAFDSIMLTGAHPTKSNQNLAHMSGFGCPHRLTLRGPRSRARRFAADMPRPDHGC
jgi:hypothetical protein